MRKRDHLRVTLCLIFSVLFQTDQVLGQDTEHSWRLVFVTPFAPEPDRPPERLISAIREGCDVRVGVPTGGGATVQTDTYSSVPAVAISPGENWEVVTGFLVGAPTTSVSVGNGMTFDPPTAAWPPLTLIWRSLNTSADSSIVVFNRETLQVVSEDSRKRLIKWFVRCGWELVYEHSADGNAISGSFRNLVEAIEDGAEVKIRYAAGGEVEWFRTLPSVVVHQDVDESVTTEFAIVAGAVVDIPDTKAIVNGRDFELPYALEWQAYGTNGLRERLEFNYETSDVVSRNSDRIAVSWFVRR